MSTPRALYLKANIFTIGGQAGVITRRKNCRTSSKGSVVGVQRSMGILELWVRRRYTLASRNSSVFEWAMVIFMPRNYTFLRRLPRTFRVTFRPNRRSEFFAADPLPRSTNEGPRTRTPFAPRQRSIVHLDKVLLPSPSATTFNFLRNYYAVTMPEERGVWMIARGKRLMIVSSNLTFGKGFLGGWCSILDVCLLIVQFILRSFEERYINW